MDDRVGESLGKGLFVFAREVDHYCASTDAFAGTSDHYISDHPTMDEARDAQASYWADPDRDCDHDDQTVIILPSWAKRARAEATAQAMAMTTAADELSF